MRIGILGAGWAGSVHARAYSQMTDVEIAGIVGRRESKVKERADTLGVPGLTDPWKLLDDDTVDAIDVCYPTYIHRDYVVAALQRGKHVLCETPIALGLQEVDAMIAAARSSGKIALVALVMRFVDTYVYVHDAVASGELGKPLVAYAYRAGPAWGRSSADFGELVIEPMIHDFDYLNWLLGKPAAVSATGHFGPTGEMDHAFVSLEYDDLCGQVEGSHLVPTSYPFTTRLRVVCEAGAVETSYRFVGDGPPENTLTRYPEAGSPEEPIVPSQDPYLAECRYFVDCVSGKADPTFLSVETARDGLQVALAAKESLQRGGERVNLA